MGEIRLDIPGFETSFWPPYMTNLLEEVVRDWAVRVNNGNLTVFAESGKPITAEHLRIAKALVTREPNQPVDPGVMPPEVLEEVNARLAGN